MGVGLSVPFLAPYIPVMMTMGATSAESYSGAAPAVVLSSLLLNSSYWMLNLSDCCSTVGDI